MANKRKYRTLPERLYNAVVLSDGAIMDVAYGDLINAKIKHDRENPNTDENK